MQYRVIKASPEDNSSLPLTKWFDNKEDATKKLTLYLLKYPSHQYELESR